jgi:AcrR family transcriptional regulator
MSFLPITIAGKGAANILCHGKYMPHLHLSSRALKVLDTSRQLFNQDGFHNVGVDRIIESSNIAKGTFYKYFQSKEQLVEICLAFQRNLLKEEVRSLIIHTSVFRSMKSWGVFSFCMRIWMGFIIYCLKQFLKLKAVIPMRMQSCLSIGAGWLKRFINCF